MNGLVARFVEMSTCDQENGAGPNLAIGSHHYRAFVGPPEKYDLVAANQVSLLFSLGLREFHYLLDIGCGSLRAGRLLIPYLLPQHYFGIEPERWLVEDGIENEIGRDLLRIKRPSFSHDSNFDCSQFNHRFDFIMIQSIFSHASRAQIGLCLGEAAKCLETSGIAAATFVKGKDDYQGEAWVYPRCVAYRLKTLQNIAATCGLLVEEIHWPHPNGQTWVLIATVGTKLGKVLPASLRQPRSSLGWLNRVWARPR